MEVYAQSSPYAGGVIFKNSGTKENPIRVRGIRAGTARPIISGGDTTVQFDGSHYVFEGFDIKSGNIRNVFHHADDITIADTVVHDCVGHGILGADDDSGSLTLDHVEVYACGSGTTKHPIYIATDENTHPGSVFRMQYSYVHDGKGGNNVKSRAERNELYYNWIEGGYYREIELIGPENGVAEGLKREDSDVVGNVFVKTTTQPETTNVARVGGDGDADTSGRYRFVNNTFILRANSTAAVIQVFDKVESIELHNNVFYKVGGGAVNVVRTTEAKWVAGEIIAGSNNWLPAGTTLPSTVTGSITGTDPGFVNIGNYDVRVTASSILIGKGLIPTVSPAGHVFPSPLVAPRSSPPMRTVDPAGTAVGRASLPRIALGAFENGAQSTAPSPGGAVVPPTGGGASSAGDPAAPGGPGGGDPSGAGGEGCH
ncbi:hypothetical protein [Pendulispora albinea]|uniref:Pectate lyase n=1 Tax=Pendulispora albinea TaxID=2741071 RepID=A0ABZ2M5T5_9BACT